jgi:SAM-dependent methyltransferase
VKRKAIIHIGAHKTGTTTIQVALNRNATFLGDVGVVYPVALTSPESGMYGQHSLSFALRGIAEHIGTAGVNVKTCMLGVHPLDHVRQLDRNSDLILSSEDFYDLNEQQIERLKELLDGFAVKILFYVRRQDEAAQALYQTSVINYGLSKSFDQYLSANVSRFDYFLTATIWAKIFGRDSITVRRYGRSFLKNGDALADFVEAAEKLLGKELNKKAWIPVAAELNQGLPEHMVVLMRSYNSKKGDGAVASQIRNAGFTLYRKAHGSYSLISPSARRDLLDSYAKSNSLLARDYVFCEKEALFGDLAIDQSDDDWALQQKGVDACLGKFLGDLATQLKGTAEQPIIGSQLLSPSNDATQDKTVSLHWQSESAYRDIQAEARKLSADEWISVVGTACELPTRLGKVDLPCAPPAPVQTAFVGAAGRASLAEGGRFYKFVLDILAREGIAEVTSLMDFGCGWGRFTRLFQREVTEGGLYGVDPWNYAINLCRSHFPFASFVQSNYLPPLQFKDNTFDVVVAYSVFSHLVEHAAQAWINEISRVLRPGGVLIATTHGPWVLDNVKAVRSGARKACNQWEDGIANSWPDVTPLLEKYRDGEFVFIRNQNNPLPVDLYGNSFVPEAYVKNVWGNYMEFVDFVCDNRRISQAAFVLKKTR